MRLHYNKNGKESMKHHYKQLEDLDYKIITLVGYKINVKNQ